MTKDSFLSLLLEKGLALQSPFPWPWQGLREPGGQGWDVRYRVAHLLADAQLQVPRTMCEAQFHPRLALESRFSHWVSSSTGAVPGPAWAHCP